MKTIKLLPHHLIAQIAAGEVIERPAFAVKELIDNAIDASATQITVELEDTGLTKIVVTDNGTGMEKEDLLESYKLHTTSKLSDNDSLLSIQSLGFRGEALASIAAVSALTIASKTKNSPIGTNVFIKHSVLETVSSAGMPIGTRVVIENLFQNIPARKNFLKSNRTELKHIIESVYALALATPHISFQVFQDKKPILLLPPAQTHQERIYSIFNNTISTALLPMYKKDSYISVSGFILSPQQSAMVVPKQYLSINNRAVNDKLVQIAVKEAYGVLLDKNTQPSWFITISLPFESVDVNIHPRKEEVHFADQQLLYNTIFAAVTESLATNNITFTTVPTTNYLPKITKTYMGHTLKDSVLPWNTQLLTTIENGNVLQIHNLYIIMATDEGLIIIDQHAAHERILYEKFTQQFLEQKQKNISIQLPKPYIFNTSDIEYLLIEENREELERLGFCIQANNKNTSVITKIPLIFKDRNLKKLLSTFLTNFANEVFTPQIDTLSQKLLAYLSCRAAVKAGDPLTVQQMKDILKELEKLPHAVTCPHGRPLKITMPLQDLNTMFKRK